MRRKGPGAGTWSGATSCRVEYVPLSNLENTPIEVVWKQSKLLRVDSVFPGRRRCRS